MKKFDKGVFQKMHNENLQKFSDKWKILRRGELCTWHALNPCDESGELEWAGRVAVFQMWCN